MADAPAKELERLARAEFNDLGAAEIKLIACATTTGVAYAGPNNEPDDASNNPEFSESGDPVTKTAAWGAEREVRAELIRWLCIDHQASKLIDPRGLQLVGARVKNELDLRHASVAFPLSLVHCRLLSPAYFVSCQIPRLDLQGSWTGPIVADGAAVSQHIYLSATRVEAVTDQTDGVSLVQANIRGSLLFEGATIISNSGSAVSADGITLGGDIFFRAGSNSCGLVPFQAVGEVRLIGAEIRGDLDCTGGSFRNDKGNALTAERASIKGVIILTKSKTDRSSVPFKVTGGITLSGASVGGFEDEEASRPQKGRVTLDGFTYCRIEPADSRSRLRWLALDSSPATQPYRQLAKVLQDSGDARGAKCVLIAMEKKLSARDWLRWLRAFIGYGYKPGRAAVLMFLLWLGGAFLAQRTFILHGIVPTDKEAYSNVQSKREVPAYYPPFQPFMFSLEHTFPLVKLGQADKWQPAPDERPDSCMILNSQCVGSARFMRWFIWAQIVLGWLLATLFVAAVSGIVQRG